MLSQETKSKLILSLLEADSSTPELSGDGFYRVGEDYLVRTVTMIYLGKLKAETRDSLVLEDCAWIPETSRWSEFVAGKKPKEMEPYMNDVKVYKGAILDATKMSKKIKREVI
jgi:hypothetical protein